MELQYNYKVLKVDYDNKIMEVLYTPFEPNTLKEYLVSTRLPFVGESLNNVIQSYAPIGLWTQEVYDYDSVEEGTEGTFSCIIDIYREETPPEDESIFTE